MTQTPEIVSPEMVAEPAAEDLRPSEGVTLLQRVIMPRSADPLKVRTLYLDEGESSRAKVLDRQSAHIDAGREVSFATYFNAFPASYWRRWTTLQSVLLQLDLAGRCRVDVYRSKADGATIHVTGATTEPGVESSTLEFELDLSPFEDGGWYWFDVTAGDEPATLRRAGWYADRAPVDPAKLAIGICTYNRPLDCVAALGALSVTPWSWSRSALSWLPTRGRTRSRTRPASRRCRGDWVLGCGSWNSRTWAAAAVSHARCTRS